MKKILLFFVLGLLFTACKIQKLEKSLPKHAFSGVLIKEGKSGKVLFAKNAHKPFVPASNTKILSMYAALEMLPDTLPAFRYWIKGDTTFLMGTGDPTLLHPDFPKNPAWEILEQAKVIVYSDKNLHQERYGAGWSWDDYNDYYQAEINALPLYGNVVRVKGEDWLPSYFKGGVVKAERSNVKRAEHENVFYAPQVLNRTQEVPFRTSSHLVVDLLKDTLKREVIYRRVDLDPNYKTAWGLPKDTVIRRMMQPSDNHLAEQLLLMAGGADTLSSSKSIEKVKAKLFEEFPKPYVWKDGSGLSRYNLFTPAFMVHLLEEMYKKYPTDQLFSYMSVGGKAGTLRNKYKGELPYVFAKTGSMSGVYNESGYFINRKGKILVYSVLKNNFTESVSENGAATMEWMNRWR
ncbi:peptidase S13 D-Ala-D-Ala carboxypeptidase C [Leadbetterella byssophila DSM 17132]|uniref:Peptidase S13 D-Ala-D-Ala carboxypeptidase C n=1 Tax=Leadbetterella byssophila (strain DSM 17132 / JCM 16389 / KACC 11308 / NBRC 106382 / 4M15) TaxID=649349 RepID=E4RYB3_LEAB4|nr:D-alanyl-D-alanine carboxypeptidase [Leadbetterella byssophila]ADQ18149.1 peptidase S13 D-Ala-D-Ala carboxypeptidase C [Leadbetterella byssophila DSM 17132]